MTQPTVEEITVFNPKKDRIETLKYRKLRSTVLPKVKVAWPVYWSVSHQLLKRLKPDIGTATVKRGCSAAGGTVLTPGRPLSCGTVP